jgi:hypothetical protein
VSAQPPAPGPPQPPGPDHESIHCPRCSAPVGPDQDWCLECGAPARTRLAPTPNWQLPTVAIGAIVLLAGALLAFAFVKLTNDSNATPAAATTATTPLIDTAPVAPVPPPVATTLPTATTTAPVGPAAPTTVPGQTTTVPGQTTTPAPTTAGGQKTVPPFGQTTTTP